MRQKKLNPPSLGARAGCVALAGMFNVPRKLISNRHSSSIQILRRAVNACLTLARKGEASADKSAQRFIKQEE
jgi:hypothetical protein